MNALAVILPLRLTGNKAMEVVEDTRLSTCTHTGRNRVRLTHAFPMLSKLEFLHLLQLMPKSNQRICVCKTRERGKGERERESRLSPKDRRYVYKSSPC